MAGAGAVEGAPVGNLRRMPQSMTAEFGAGGAPLGVCQPTAALRSLHSRVCRAWTPSNTTRRLRAAAHRAGSVPTEDFAANISEPRAVRVRVFGYLTNFRLV
ncbi:unnamed protein product, partial [Iphiclides podalirius]